ncbi:TauD/TfdA family dioxygenase [Kribbella sp. NBC_01245]|uniref:TauD/TfdA family dioxygenase n=1 Tax=Kribbella sp. NBC_01245 TaxID=2903578 RepID=UPI002E2B2748|nr:TauD/TfdA family dioxygenase [Kribbella sp. NBC_01245]
MSSVLAPELETISWRRMDGPELVHAARAALAGPGVLRVSEFPTTTREYLRFLRAFGEPLRYYGSDAGTHPEASEIWQIKYDPESAARGETHALAGPLSAHSSQSLRDPRPRFFSMLMVNAGWQHLPLRTNGESVLAPWRLAVETMRADLGAAFDSVRQALLDEVPFPDGSSRTVAYQLASARSVDDLGIRLKSDLLPFLEQAWPMHRGTHAVRHLVDAAQKTALRISLQSGDLVLLDNDRWGHGRESVVGTAQNLGGELTLNPRELWSVTID